MSQDDRSNDARMRDRADGIDDGMIHEWLDGELDSAKAAELEALVTLSPVFAARVAEARGLLAASSRILLALDELPGNVLPKATEARPIVRPVAQPVAHPVAQSMARRWSARRWTGIAALLMVGVTGVVIARREPETTRLREPVAIATDDGAASADAARSEPQVAATTVAPTTAVTSSERSREAVAQEVRAQEVRAQVARLLNAAAPTASAPASPPPEVADRAAGSQAKATSESANLGTRGDSQATRSRVSASALRTLVPSATGAASERLPVAPDIAPSDILAGDLLLAVQRVRCAPVCGQLRIEIARDGRVRSWRQSLGSSGSPDTATLTERELADLKRTVDELRLDTLPAMLRLDGAQCRSVGSLRESLRVEFVHNDQPRRVMGLPWCSDGTHVMDKAAAAIEAAADSAISRASGASSRYW